MSDISEIPDDDWRAFERAHVWHPYAPMPVPLAPFPVVSARGVRLFLEDGRELIDGMASWWAVIHGYNHPVLNRAVTDQLHDMAHVMFGGLTHRSAAELAALLVQITPEPLEKVFFSDSGSVSIEVAIKLSLQYWHSSGRPEKQRLLTVRNGYHGDTFGAMGVSDPENGMHHLFAGILPRHLFAPAPDCRPGEWDGSRILEFKALLEKNNREIAAVILEPLVQGAGGMRFYCPEYLIEVRRLCTENGVLLILDEIATGFGRTGTIFACEQADVVPDIMCLGKALTGGYMTLAATLTTSSVAAKVSEGGTPFMHGPTFMANPLACSVALASIKLLLGSPWQSRVARIEERFRTGLMPCADIPMVRDVRVYGAIGVIEFHENVDMSRMQRRLVEEGVWLRPFGRLLYAMPPYVIGDDELDCLIRAMVRVASDTVASEKPA